MKRIILMVIRNILFVPYWSFQLFYYARHTDQIEKEKKWNLLKKIVYHANKGGRIKVEYSGVENIPKKESFIMYPNHQGMYDVLAIISCCPRFFSVVSKQEVKNVPFLKQVFGIMKAKFMDRSDIRQSMKIIKEVTEEVKEGNNYLIFPEGTRSKNGNELLDFKAGSLKAAMNAKCPIVPVALIDAFQGFDSHSVKPVTVQVHFLPPINYEDYKEKKAVEVSEQVKNTIEETIKKYSKSY